MSTKSRVKVSNTNTPSRRKAGPGPDFTFEKSMKGLVCGLDEVGRAPLAGPVVAACVFIPKDKLKESVWSEVNDSKLLSAAKREELFDEIRLHSAWAISEACSDEIENINIVQASFLAMRRAYDAMIANFNVRIDGALIDGSIKPEFPCKVKTIVKGDSKSVSIAAASIIAKVYRDRMMQRLGAEFPHYGWEQNAGYPTRQHLDAIQKHGLTHFHRKTFAPVRNFIEFGNIEPQLKIAV
jgi:ribonuclease HII